MYDRIREALWLNPSEENTPQVDVFSGSPAPRFTVKSKIEDDEENAPPFILNTPTRKTSERWVMIAPYLLEVKDDWSERDLPPHMPRCEGRGERDQAWGRPQGPLPPPPPGGGRGGFDPPWDDDDNDHRCRHKCRNARVNQPFPN